MTIHNYSTPIAHVTDADFRKWGSDLSSALQSAGLVKTADTGQIDWVGVLKPLGGAVAGYEIFRFNDALQSTAPIFIKIEYGTTATTSNAYPGIWVSVGTGADGAGLLTGLKTTRRNLTASTSGTSGGVPNVLDAYTTFTCVKDGYMACLFKLGGAYGGEPTAIAFFSVGRSVNDDGTESAEGAYFIYRNGAGSGASAAAQMVYLRFTDQTSNPTTQLFGTIPGGLSNSLVDGQPQIFKFYVMTPRMRPLMQIANVFSSEYPAGTTFQATVMGSQPRTYLSAGVGASYTGGANSINHSIAFIWE